jgi:ATP-dependent helicase/nuclease subunit B
MLSHLLISPNADFWIVVARHINEQQLALAQHIIVPTFSHAQCLKTAMVAQSPGVRLAPPIHTLDAWLALHSTQAAPANSQRMMSLFAQLREHAWLTDLFGAADALDLLPLANTLLTLFDELSAALVPTCLPTVQAGQLDQRWQQAMQQLALPARQLLSEEAQLVWTLWKAQIDNDDPAYIRQCALMHLAQHAKCPLLWIHPVPPDPMQQAFLQAYARRQPVCVITLDWRASVLPPLYVRAWPELVAGPGANDIHETDDTDDTDDTDSADAGGSELALSTGVIALCPAADLEQEARQGAQSILNWLQSGKTRLALVAQDRVVARRIRALLERAQVIVADETGWKLSTTRAAAVLAAWFEVVNSQADVMAVLDFLKSPFVWMYWRDKSDWLIQLEMILRRQNVQGGWNGILQSLPPSFSAEPLIELKSLAQQFTGCKSLTQWNDLTQTMLEQLGMKAALAQDLAGQQVLALLANISAANHEQSARFHLPEWHACVSLEMEATPFVAAHQDQRVVMLPLNGARLRRFDAVLMVGCDSIALPSQAPEILFFANAVRRELGLATREARQQQQLRDFAEILLSGADVLLSWQQFKNGEPNTCCAWLERLQLVLAREHLPPLPQVRPPPNLQRLLSKPTLAPQPSAPDLLPKKLSASGYQKFLACPYAFFARQMLHLSQDDVFSDLPEKRDYGDWLHGILYQYHEQLRLEPTQDRQVLLSAISAQKFEQELQRGAGALGFYVRWQQTMPRYLEWAGQQAGQWQYQEGEQQRERLVTWGTGQEPGPGQVACQVVLHGRLDRIDQDSNGERKIIDYKTIGASDLRNKLKGEDQQLTFYGLLEPEAAQAVFLSLDKKKIDIVCVDDFPERRQRLEQHILHSMQALQAGAVLPANGNASACEYCEMGGLCRKGAWT